MHLSPLVLAASLSATASAAIQGFNYGASFNNNQAKQQMDFEYEFTAAKQLPGTNGWAGARLYTMIQHGTDNTVIEAIQAAINTQTTLLLGLWASAGQDNFNNEIVALQAAIQQFGPAFADLVVGISVGSEDLYRITPTGIENNSGPGAQPAELINYVAQTRNAIRGTVLDGKPVGHVDTWTVYVDSNNGAFIDTLDFLGVDAYPYYQSTMSNSIGSASQLFFDAYYATINAARGKPVWVTETGWPVSGPDFNEAVAGPENAQIYWQDVTCQLVQDNVNLYYYTLQDVQYGNPIPSFGIKPGGDLMMVQPLFNLSCPVSSKSSLSTGFAMASSVGSGIVTSIVRPTQLVSMPSATPPAVSAASMTSLALNASSKISGPFEAPNLIVPVDKANPDKVIGNGFFAQLSPTVSTIFAFDIKPADAGKTCTLVLYLPPPFEYPDLAPVQIRTPGGIHVARLDRPVSMETNANDVGSANPVGDVGSVQLGHRYNIASSPCQAGQAVAYEVDSLSGLTMSWFQMADPPIGLFLLVE